MLLGPPALAATVLYVYDELGRLVAEIDPAAETTLYSYDAAGNLLSVSRGSSSQFRIVSFAPTRGRPGDVVTIFGSGFGTTPGQNTVAFNGTPSTVTASTANTITVSVPAGVTTGLISVTSPTGSGLTAQPFVLAIPPTITAVTPSAVSRGATTTITISGSQLATARAVTFSQAGIGARIVSGATESAVSVDLSVAANVPLGAYGFSVTNDAGTSDSGSVTLSVSTSLLGPALTTTGPLSVYPRKPEAGALPGNAVSVSRQPLSVHLPAVIPGAPPGNALSVSQPISVSNP